MVARQEGSLVRLARAEWCVGRQDRCRFRPPPSCIRWRTPDAVPPKPLRASVYPRRWHRRAQAGGGWTHRWGRPTQRRGNAPSSIGETQARSRLSSFRVRAGTIFVGPRVSDSRRIVRRTGLSSLSAQRVRQRLPRCATGARKGDSPVASEQSDRRVKGAASPRRQPYPRLGDAASRRECFIRAPFSRVLGTLISGWQFETRRPGVAAGSGWRKFCTANRIFCGARPGQNTPGLRHWPQ